MIIFVSDMFADQYGGGAELTTEAIIEASLLPAFKVNSKDLDLKTVKAHRDKFWVFGNFTGVSKELLIYFAQNMKYSVLEYDYKFCKLRSIEKHIAHSGTCDCQMSDHGKTISIFLAKASHLWFMSTGQRELYCEKYSFLNKKNSKVLSSVFSPQTLDKIESLDCNNKNDVWLIQNSPSWIKGTEDAIAFAKANNFKYELFEDLTYDQMLEKFAQSKGFLTFPRGHDTCPRTSIEAKLLGCEVICNEYVQHRDEPWFTGTNEESMEYLRGRTRHFWDETLAALDDILPTKNSKSSEDTHFKIVIPVYNAEDWIGRAIRSVKDQDYQNFQCIITNDISTDSTLQKCLDAVGGDPRFKVIDNTEKKYALRNIYESIEESSPNPEDVIVSLDGDDWFPTHFVLSKLNEVYKNEDCLMTYGSFVQFPHGTIGREASRYPEDVIRDGSYRKDKWRASHLKTFKSVLWNEVNVEDLRDNDGEFYEMTYDQAMMLPMLEMCGERAKYIPQVMYVYNVSNPNAVNKTRAKKQHNLMLKIRNKAPYKRQF